MDQKYMDQPFLIFRKKEQRDLPYNYGKYVEDRELQEPFKCFLEREKKVSNKEAEHYAEEAMKAKDNAEKIRLLQQGAKEENALCAQELGIMYRMGAEPLAFARSEINHDKAEKYLTFAAECGFSIAMEHLGLLYIESKKDDKYLKGVQWICKAVINGGMVYNLYKLIRDVCQVESTNILFEIHFSVYFRDICDKEENTPVENQFLGWCYYEGMCCIQNLDRAKAHWLAGEKQGSQFCTFLLRNVDFGNQKKNINQNYSDSNGSVKDYLPEESMSRYKDSIADKEGSKAMSIASLIIGILCMFCFGYLSFVFAIIGIILGVKGKDKGGRGIGIAGIVLNIMAVVVWGIIVHLYLAS